VRIHTQHSCVISQVASPRHRRRSRGRVAAISPSSKLEPQTNQSTIAVKQTQTMPRSWLEEIVMPRKLQ
jgi:hypothetical protein